MKDLKTVVVSGASKGIGFALALEFCKRGHCVLAIARNRELLENLLEQSENEKGELYIIDADIKNFSAAMLPSAFAEIDILINNAGYLINKPFAEIEEEELREVYDINVFAPFKMVQQLLNYFSADAHIINIGSVGGITGSQKFPGLSAYSSSKAAASCLSECWQAEFQNTDWRFNSLALGAVQTEMLALAFPAYQAQVSAEEMAHFIADFALESSGVLRGKTIPVSRSNP